VTLSGSAGYSAVVAVWRDLNIWRMVAGELHGYRRDGMAGLLTEDTVRFAAARAFVAGGADPAGLNVEWPHPVLTGSRIDLTAGGRPPRALIEFKYPREPNEKNAAWTMTLGEVLKDFYRLATCPGQIDRLFIYVETAPLRRYMTRTAARYGLPTGGMSAGTVLNKLTETACRRTEKSARARTDERAQSWDRDDNPAAVAVSASVHDSPEGGAVHDPGTGGPVGLML
jgi:hypothetical protein